MLYRLNIDNEVLFLGLQGLATALRDRLWLLDRFVPNGVVDLRSIGRAWLK